MRRPEYTIPGDPCAERCVYGFERDENSMRFMWTGGWPVRATAAPNHLIMTFFTTDAQAGMGQDRGIRTLTIPACIRRRRPQAHKHHPEQWQHAGLYPGAGQRQRHGTVGRLGDGSVRPADGELTVTDQARGGDYLVITVRSAGRYQNMILRIQKRHP